VINSQDFFLDLGRWECPIRNSENARSEKVRMVHLETWECPI
jgi:hypothetical protein